MKIVVISGTSIQEVKNFLDKFIAQEKELKKPRSINLDLSELGNIGDKGSLTFIKLLHTIMVNDVVVRNINLNSTKIDDNAIEELVKFVSGVRTESENTSPYDKICGLKIDFGVLTRENQSLASANLQANRKNFFPDASGIALDVKFPMLNNPVVSPTNNANDPTEQPTQSFENTNEWEELLNETKPDLKK